MMSIFDKIRALYHWDCSDQTCEGYPADNGNYGCKRDLSNIVCLSNAEIHRLYDELIGGEATSPDGNPQPKAVAGTAGQSRESTQTDRNPKVDHFRDVTKMMADTYEAKNHDYGDSFAILRRKYPEAICIRLMDKLLRLQTLVGGESAKVEESIDDTLLDIATYAVMELVERKVEHEN